MKVVNRILGEAMTPYQKGIHKDPKKACNWAIKHGQRFPEAEPYIAKDPEWAFRYAMDVIEGQWPEAEPHIAKHPEWALHYADNILEERFPEGEAAIAKHPEWAYYYAGYVIKRRWPEGEKAIATDPEWAYKYAIRVIKGRWPEAEAEIAASESPYRDDYLDRFPDAKDDWAINGWIDWLDT